MNTWVFVLLTFFTYIISFKNKLALLTTTAVGLMCFQSFLDLGMSRICQMSMSMSKAYAFSGILLVTFFLFNVHRHFFINVTFYVFTVFYSLFYSLLIVHLVPGAELTVGHILWPVTHVTYQSANPWPAWPVTHDLVPDHGMSRSRLLTNHDEFATIAFTNIIIIITLWVTGCH